MSVLIVLLLLLSSPGALSDQALFLSQVFKQCLILFVSVLIVLLLLLSLQEHSLIKRYENKDVDVAGYVCQVMDKMPEKAILTDNSSS